MLATELGFVNVRFTRRLATPNCFWGKEEGKAAAEWLSTRQRAPALRVGRQLGRSEMLAVAIDRGTR